MIHRYIIEVTDEIKGFEEDIERLDREWGIEELEPCEDCVSRANLISKLKILDRRYGSDFYRETRKIVDKLPSVTPQYTDAEIQKMQEMEQAEIQKAYELGKANNETSYWKYNPDGIDWGIGAWECAECHCRNDMIPSMIAQGTDKPPITHDNINPLNWAGSKFCPNCGRRMVEPQESDDKV